MHFDPFLPFLLRVAQALWPVRKLTLKGTGQLTANLQLHWLGKGIQILRQVKVFGCTRQKEQKLSQIIIRLIFAHDFAILEDIEDGSWANSFDAGEAKAWRWFGRDEFVTRARRNCWNLLQMVFEWRMICKGRFSIAMFHYQRVDCRIVVLVRILHTTVMLIMSAAVWFRSAGNTYKLWTNMTCEKMAIWSHKLCFAHTFQTSFVCDRFRSNNQLLSCTGLILCQARLWYALTEPVQTLRVWCRWCRWGKNVAR